MIASTLIFVDTSIQTRRILGEPAEVHDLHAELAASTIQAVTSSYVWMEFQRTVVADFAHVHHLMQEHSDWGSLFRHVLDRDRAFRPRSAVRCTQIIGNFYISSRQNFELARSSLAEQIISTLHQRFWTYVTPIPDSIVCDLVTTKITLQANRAYAVPASCRKETAACRLPEFLAERQTELHTMLAYLTAHPHAVKDQARVERLLTAVIENPRAALGQSSCWPLGDIIIALQIPENALLWTLDADFAPLTAALGRQLYMPQPRVIK